MKRSLLIILLALASTTVFSQRGKNGNPTITAAQVVNEYTTLTAVAKIGDSSITVANNTLNVKGRFASNLAAGDLVLIIQMQGATINGSLNIPWHPRWGLPNDSSWGKILNYNDAGNNEFAEVKRVSGANTIVFNCELQNNYNDTGKVQIIRVPRYNSLTINAGGSISCDPWDSAKGGVVAIEVLNNTVINGSITVSGNGFRGGKLDYDVTTYGVNNTAAEDSTFGKQKGEGIGGYEWKYDVYGGMYGLGAGANAGGGGDAHNGGGGGGANGGNPANWINGFGNPDVSTANYIKAWNLEYTWMSAFTSAGGGRGGYTFSGKNGNPLTTGPNNNGVWGGDARRAEGGLGGRPLDYTTGRLFIGGGGGAGDQDNGVGGAGGNGAGLVYLMSYGTVSGTGQITANGANGVNSTYAIGPGASDGAGGAGAGGTVIINSIGNISGISIQANGGTGGNQVTGAFITEAEGPGGGGGGGYIATSNALGTETATGGANGTTSSGPMKNFPPNGATKGGAGTTGATVTNFQIVAKNDTICSGQTATLNATLTGTVPGGTTIEWYTVATGGAVVGTGASYTTPALTVNTTYYVGTCPGTYRQAVNVIISGSAATTISPPATICSGNSTPLTASGGTAYSWSPATGLTCTTCPNPTASPTVTTTYTASITTACGIIKDSVKVTVTSLSGVTISSAPPAVCYGNSATLTASGGTSYSWTTGGTTSSISVTPAATTTYSVLVTNSGCSKDTSVTVTVKPLPIITLSASPSLSICPGSSTKITATGGGTYSWNTGATTAGITVSPASNTTYSVAVTGANGCPKDTTVTVTVNPSPTVSVTPPTPTICSGGNVVLTASGASSYAWSASAGLTCTNCPNPTASPASTTTYTVIGSSAAGCTDTAMVTVTVGSALTPFISGADSVCKGNSTTLTASGGSSYTWNTGSTNASITVSPTTITSYTVVATNGACSGRDSVTVKVNPVPVVTLSASPSLSICPGASTTITATGGGKYLWNTGATTAGITVTPGSNTTYSVTVTNASGCPKDTTVTVVVNSNPVVSITPSAPTICPGGSVALTASGASNYTWSSSSGLTCTNCPNPTANPGSTTTYTVVGTNASGCTDTAKVTVTVGTKPVVSISGADSVCSGNSTTLTASGGGTYSWNTGSTSSSITINPSSITSYTVTVSNGTCSARDSATVKVNPLPIVTLSGNNSICVGSNTTITASGGATYLWNTGATTAGITVSPVSTITYSVTVTSTKGCPKDTTVTVTVNPVPTPSITPPSATICAGSSTTLTAAGGSSYLWSNAETTAIINVSPASTITYSVTVSNGGCSATASATVTVNSLPSVTLGGNTSICAGDSTQITATGGGTYSWNTGSTNATISVKPATSTTYSLTVTNASGCHKDTNISVTVNSLPVPGVSGPQAICPGLEALISASGGSSYTWNPPIGLSNPAIANPIANPAVTTTYTVTIANGPCNATDTLTVTVNEKCDSIYIPNVFTPNGDGKNDFFLVTADGMKDYSIEIFNRWGEKIYSSNQVTNPWDGKSSAGVMEPDGVYYYVINAVYPDGKAFNRDGFIQLLK